MRIRLRPRLPQRALAGPCPEEENIDVMDFALSNTEMAAIRALDKEKRYFNMSYEDQVRWFKQWNPED
ncbi:MAG: hypothetical protein II849_03795 [Bacteroidales bacterium]|nr:hypothetical protein [Bacteroidales bacterium]